MNTLRFTGRKTELDKLKECWSLASNTETPSPQVVLIKGERGVGKTRLAFEFYRWLSEYVDPKTGPSGYWPDAMAIYQNAINLNPQPSDCNFDIHIPYLWWGLRVSNSRNPIDTISSFDRYLAPHLAMLLASSIKHKKGTDLAAALADLGFDVGVSFIEDLTYLGLLKRLAEGVKKGVDIVRGGVGEDSIEKALEVPHSRANSILQQFESVFNQERNYAKTPSVILIDDAQDADPEKDPAILSFIEQLFHNSITQKWPMLILVTHWKRELSLEVTPQDCSFAGLLRHFVHGDSTENGPAADLPGGFLNETNLTEIDLGPLGDLSLALKEQLSGLSSEKSTAILNATGGNPRYLEQVILYARGRKGYFEDHNINNSLTPDGFNKVLKATKSRDIFEVVRERLTDAPVEVQEAICLASLQGVRFAYDIVNAIAKEQMAKDVQIPLGKAEDTYYWVAGTKKQTSDGIGEFVERLFLQVAEDVRPHVKSLGGESKLLVSFRDTIRRLVEDQDFVNSGQLDMQLITFSIAADLFEKSSDSDERTLARKALSYVAMVHLHRNSLEAATAAYERLLKTPPSGTWLLGTDWQDRIKTLDFLAVAYRKLNWPSKVSSTYKRMIWMGYHQIDDQNQRVFVFSRSPEEVRQVFENWKRERLEEVMQGEYFDDMDPKPDIAFVEERLEKDYFSSVRAIVQSLLGLAELARAWPSLNFDEGDDPITDAPFMIKALKTDDDGNLTGEKIDIEGPELFSIHKERAYILGTLLAEHFAQYEHFKLLVDDIARSNSDKLNTSAAIDALERAFNIAEDMNDHILQIQALNNLGIVHGQNGDHKKSEEILLKAGQINNDNYSGQVFSVVALSNGTSIEHRRAEDISDTDESRILGHLSIPSRLSPAFDEDPDHAVGQFRKLVRLVGNIEGNLGHNLLEAGEIEKAEARFKHAMESYVDLNDGPNIALTFNNLAATAKRRGDTKTACDYWRRSISVYEKLKEVDSNSSDGRDILWINAIRELQEIMEVTECGK